MLQKTDERLAKYGRMQEGAAGRKRKAAEGNFWG